MSTRTIVEINHDRLNDLDNPEELKKFVMALKGGSFNFELSKGEQPEIARGCRVLLQRHHSTDVLIRTKYQDVKL